MVEKTIVLEGADATAFGHPSSCTEPAPGTVENRAPQSVSINGTPVATTATADIHFDSHAHSYSGDPPTCGSFQSHDIDPSVVSQSVTVNGSPLYVKDDVQAEATDPGTGGPVEIDNTGSNNSVVETT